MLQNSLQHHKQQLTKDTMWTERTGFAWSLQRGETSLRLSRSGEPSLDHPPSWSKRDPYSFVQRALKHRHGRRSPYNRGRTKDQAADRTRHCKTQCTARRSPREALLPNTSRSLAAKHRFTTRREALGEVVDVECSNKKIKCHTAKHQNRATKDKPCSRRPGTSLQMGDCIPCHPRPMHEGNDLSTSMNKGHAKKNQKECRVWTNKMVQTLAVTSGTREHPHPLSPKAAPSRRWWHQGHCSYPIQWDLGFLPGKEKEMEGREEYLNTASMEEGDAHRHHKCPG
jgi:hypothetical protein